MAGQRVAKFACREGCGNVYHNRGDRDDHENRHNKKMVTCPHCGKTLLDSKNTWKRHIPQCEKATLGAGGTSAQAAKSPSKRECPWCGKSCRSDNLKRHVKSCKTRLQEQQGPLAQEGLVVDTPVEEPVTDEQSSSASGKSPVSLSSLNMSLNDLELGVLLSAQEPYQELPDSASCSLKQRLDQADASIAATTPSQSQETGQEAVQQENWWNSEESVNDAIILGLAYPAGGMSYEESALI